MTEAEFRERIKEILYRHGMYSPTTEAQYWQEKLLEEFNNLFTEAMKGYVKLSEPQPFPSVDNNISLDCQGAQAEMRDKMLAAGFRRVEGLTLEEHIKWFNEKQGKA